MLAIPGNRSRIDVYVANFPRVVYHNQDHAYAIYKPYLQVLPARGLLDSCRGMQVEPQVCRSQQLQLGLVTDVGMVWCPQLGITFECFTERNIEFTDSMTKGTGACKANNMLHEFHLPDMSA